MRYMDLSPLNKTWLSLDSLSSKYKKALGEQAELHLGTTPLIFGRLIGRTPSCFKKQKVKLLASEVVNNLDPYGIVVSTHDLKRITKMHIQKSRYYPNYLCSPFELQNHVLCNSTILKNKSKLFITSFFHSLWIIGSPFNMSCMGWSWLSISYFSLFSLIYRYKAHSWFSYS